MDIAYAMRELDEKQRRTVFEVLEAPDAAVVLEEVDPEIEAELVEQTQDPKLAQIIDARRSSISSPTKNPRNWKSCSSTPRTPPAGA